jgi:hypothetical protein
MATNQQQLMRAPRELQGVQVSGGYTFDEMYRIAQACHASGLFSDTKDANQALVKLLKGSEMGLPPTTAMNAFDIIQGHIFVKPWAIAAKINACGYGSYRVEEQTDEQCTILFSRKYPGKGWVDCPKVTFTFAQAQAQKLTERSVHWKSSPAHMLYQRCMGRGGAMYFPELLAGLEPPQDDTPIPVKRHIANVSDLYGDAAGQQEARRFEARPVEEPPRGTKTSAAHAETLAWETLEAHKDDAQLPDDLLTRIQAALSPLAPATEGEAFALAQEVLSCLDHHTGVGA